MGFSQGGCLVAEYLARGVGERLAAPAVLTGALIGVGTATRETPRSLRGFPLLLASGEKDSWVPATRVHETAEVFRAAGATVRLEMSDEPEHGVHDRALKAAGDLIDQVIRTG
jgi:phospholipase/carboxylesterase